MCRYRRGDLRARDGVAVVLRAGRAGVARDGRGRAHALLAHAGGHGAALAQRRGGRRQRRAREQVRRTHLLL